MDQGDSFCVTGRTAKMVNFARMTAEQRHFFSQLTPAAAKTSLICSPEVRDCMWRLLAQRRSYEQGLVPDGGLTDVTGGAFGAPGATGSVPDGVTGVLPLVPCRW